MTATTGQRRHHLDLILVEYFTRCPDEELGQTDIRQKWGGHPQTIRHTMTRLGAIGWLSLEKRAKNDGTPGNHEWVASAGPELLRMRGGR